jgi:hypothetical protein
VSIDHERDFTEEAYRQLIDLARQRYAFLRFASAATAAAGVLWRHDIDLSVHRGLALARIEHAAGVHATYFVYLHSRFYNALEDAIVERLRLIAGLGHDLGLHFDRHFVPGGATLDAVVAAEARIIRDVIGVPVTAVSFHDPDLPGTPLATADEVGGLVNASGATISARFEYGSDSNGYWRFKPLRDVISSAGSRLQVLTHPEWWVPQPMSPRARVARAIDGRAAFAAAKYDAVMNDIGRKNIR